LWLTIPFSSRKRCLLSILNTAIWLGILFLYSFVRQLNKYNFHKINTVKAPDGTQSWEFQNPLFHRDNADWVNIKRKESVPRRSDAGTGGTVENLDRMAELETDQVDLRHEVYSLRQKLDSLQKEFADCRAIVLHQENILRVYQSKDPNYAHAVFRPDLNMQSGRRHSVSSQLEASGHSERGNQSSSHQVRSLTEKTHQEHNESSGSSKKVLEGVDLKTFSSVGESQHTMVNLADNSQQLAQVQSSRLPVANQRAEVKGTRVVIVETDPESRSHTASILESLGCIIGGNNTSGTELKPIDTNLELALWGSQLDPKGYTYVIQGTKFVIAKPLQRSDAEQMLSRWVYRQAPISQSFPMPPPRRESFTSVSTLKRKDSSGSNMSSQSMSDTQFDAKRQRPGAPDPYRPYLGPPPVHYGYGGQHGPPRLADTRHPAHPGQDVKPGTSAPPAVANNARPHGLAHPEYFEYQNAPYYMPPRPFYNPYEPPRY
jgi:HSF-type DNA-binding